MRQAKILFIDRDGTLINEPDDEQVDRWEKLQLCDAVIPSLLALQNAGFTLVMVSNQDGLGTPRFPESTFWPIQNSLLALLASQGVQFEGVYICPHMPDAGCDCRKPRVGLVLDYLNKQIIDRQNSFVIGDRDTDLEFARNLGIQGLRIGSDTTPNWHAITKQLINRDRMAEVERITNETQIRVAVNLDAADLVAVNTGIGFFDHMLEQVARHGGFALSLTVKGDLQVDDHHTVEDTALALGDALRQALGDKRGIGRYGFVLPMDESLAQAAIDLSGRSVCQFEACFERDTVGSFSTELVSHFFQSLAQSLPAAIHLTVRGDNTHHMVEACFKALGRCLRAAITKVDSTLPTTKGIL